MIYCPSSDCTKPRNQESSSFCSHCGTPLKIGDRFFLTEPLEAASRSFLAVDQHLPSKPRCLIVNRGELSVAAGWNPAQFARLESLGNQGHLPKLIALVDCPTAPSHPGPTVPSQLLASTWMGDGSLAQQQKRDGGMTEVTLQRHLNTILADLVQIHDQGFIHGDIRPCTLVQRRNDQRLLAASYREIAPICETTKSTQGQTQDLEVLQYWAPERRLGQPVPASDLYSLGVSAIQLLTAQPLDQLFDVAEDCWCWEDCLETELSDGFRALLNGMIERATRRRYGSAVDVLRDLAHLDDLAELAELAEPIAPLQPALFAVPSSGHDAGNQAEAIGSPASVDKTTTTLKESEIATFSLNGETPAPRNFSDSRSLPIGNAIKDADHQTAPAVSLEQTVIYGQFQEKLPSAEAPAEQNIEPIAGGEPEQPTAKLSPGRTQPEKKIRIPQSLIAEQGDIPERATETAPLESPKSLAVEDSPGKPETKTTATSLEISPPADSSTAAPGPEKALAPKHALALESPGRSPASRPAQLHDQPKTEAAAKAVKLAPDAANLSLTESLETPTLPPQEPQPVSNPRRSQQNTRELIAKVLANPLAISIGILVQQLAQRYETQEQSYLPWEIMLSLKQLQRTPENQRSFATQLLEMANFYRDQIHQGHRDLHHLTIAIVTYEQALKSLNQDDSAWPTVCHDLGHMYLNLSRQHPSYRIACIQKSVATFQRGLQQAEVNDGAYLELQNQLGEAYGTLAASESPAKNWQGAIAAYQAALAVCDAELPDPTSNQEIHRNERHGAIQNNLGTALWNLSLHCSDSQTSEHLQGAIAAYNAALAHHDPEAEPVRFGMIQNNLGTAYLNLAQSEKSIDLLRLAIGTYQVALIYRKRHELPLAHAATQNNLGAACLQLANHAYADPQAQRESLEQSIIAYEAALKLVRELSAVGSISIGFDPSGSRLNLALAHQHRGCLTESDQNSSVIFAHLETAMQIYLDLLAKQPPESDIHERALEYLGKTMHHLSEYLQIADDHPLLAQVPNHLVAEMSQQFQRQLQQVS